MNIRSDEVKLFLSELTELSRKHGITIGGCGCCNSPFLEEMKGDGKYGEPDSHQDVSWEKLEAKHGR